MQQSPKSLRDNLVKAIIKKNSKEISYMKDRYLVTRDENDNFTFLDKVKQTGIQFKNEAIYFGNLAKITQFYNDVQYMDDSFGV